jgi:hypothetical protein
MQASSEAVLSPGECSLKKPAGQPDNHSLYHPLFRRRIWFLGPPSDYRPPVPISCLHRYYNLEDALCASPTLRCYKGFYRCSYRLINIKTACFWLYPAITGPYVDFNHSSDRSQEPIRKQCRRRFFSGDALYCKSMLESRDNTPRQISAAIWL